MRLLCIACTLPVLVRALAARIPWIVGLALEPRLPTLPRRLLRVNTKTPSRRVTLPQIRLLLPPEPERNTHTYTRLNTSLQVLVMPTFLSSSVISRRGPVASTLLVVVEGALPATTTMMIPTTSSINASRSKRPSLKNSSMLSNAGCLNAKPSWWTILCWTRVGCVLTKFGVSHATNISRSTAGGSSMLLYGTNTGGRDMGMCL